MKEISCCAIVLAPNQEIFTTHICSVRDGNIYTWECLSVHHWWGVPNTSSDGGGVPHLRSDGGGYPIPGLMVGGYLVYPWPGLDGGGYPGYPPL